jgi:hypothetical protein
MRRLMRQLSQQFGQQLLAYAMWAGTAGETLPVPTEPIPVRKQAGLLVTRDGFSFCGIGHGKGAVIQRYGPVAQAVCLRKQFGHNVAWSAVGSAALPEHPAPHPDCSCGFYGWRASQLDPEGRDLRNDSIYWRIDAELYGRVQVHRLGYRAEKQRVLTVRNPTRCGWCHRAWWWTGQESSIDDDGATRAEPVIAEIGPGRRLVATCWFCRAIRPTVTYTGNQLRAMLAPLEVVLEPPPDFSTGL